MIHRFTLEINSYFIENKEFSTLFGADNPPLFHGGLRSKTTTSLRDQSVIVNEKLSIPILSYIIDLPFGSSD
jgi:hypothetical protein